MSEFVDEDLAGSRFERVELRGATFREVDLTGARFYNVYLPGALLRGVWLENVDINGVISNVRINGVDVGPLIEAELNQRYPDREQMRPDDADGFRAAYAILERLWAQTVDRARGLPEELLHERVDGEWSFIETLRHLVMATDAWVLRAVLGESAPYHPLGLPHDEMPADIPNVPRDLTVRPSLEEILVPRAERMAKVRQVLADLTDERLADMTEPVLEPGYPESESFAVRRCLQAILNEEWEHRLFAERDLDALASRRALAP